jgi:hypothetical protein
MKDHAIAYAGAGIISILLFTTILGFIWNSKNKRNLEEERDKTESLEAENRMVQNELDKLRRDYTSLQIRNDSANERIEEGETGLSERDRRIASLSRSNEALNKSQKDFEQLKNDNAQLQNNFADLRKEHEELIAKNKELQAAVEDLQAQKSDIASEFAQSETYDADNFVTYATRGKKDKLVLKARCAQRLNANFDVPANLTDSVTFQIITPEGTKLGPGNKGVSWVFSDPRNMIAGLQTVKAQASRRIDLTYNATGKLTKGEYQIKLISNNMNIGNCRLILK